MPRCPALEPKFDYKLMLYGLFEKATRVLICIFSRVNVSMSPTLQNPAAPVGRVWGSRSSRVGYGRVRWVTGGCRGGEEAHLQ